MVLFSCILTGNKSDRRLSSIVNMRNFTATKKLLRGKVKNEVGEWAEIRAGKKFIYLFDCFFTPYSRKFYIYDGG